MKSKSTLIILFSTLLLISSCSIFKGNSKNKFYSKEGNFKINFAEAPEVESQTVSTEVGDIVMYTYMYEESFNAIYI